MATILTADDVIGWRRDSLAYIALHHIDKITNSHEALRARVAELEAVGTEDLMGMAVAKLPKGGVILGDDQWKVFRSHLAALEQENSELRAKLENAKDFSGDGYQWPPT